MAKLLGDGASNYLKDDSADNVSQVRGGDGDDQLYGLDNSDILLGETGNDALYGGAGDDVLLGGAGADSLVGGDGYDLVSYFYSKGVQVSLDGSLTATGDAAGDWFWGDEQLEGSRDYADMLAGDENDNTIWGLGGNDKLYGRDGADEMYGDAGKDKLFGEDGDDLLMGGAGADVLNGGAGEDTASYYFDAGVVVSLDKSFRARGAAIGDKLVSIENLYGSALGNDFLGGNSGENDLFGFGGNDTLFGRAGNDFLEGGDGEDKLLGGAGDDYLHGGAGADKLDGGAGHDVASYYFSDGVSVSLDKSIVATGPAIGDKFVSIENLEGSLTGNDVLAGNKAANTIWGFGGDDWIRGGDGADRLFGGDGDDRFAYFKASEGGDVITDFSAGDLIEISGSGFGQLPSGTLASDQFRSGGDHLAQTGDERFLFDTSDHSLWFDADGNGSAAAIKLATFSTGAALSTADILVV